MYIPVYIATLVVIFIALLVVAKNFLNIKKSKKHATKEEDAMYALAKNIREGAKIFMKTEYGGVIPFKGKPVGITFVVIIIAIGFSLFVESSSGLTYVLGALMSSAAVFIGM